MKSSSPNISGGLNKSKGKGENQILTTEILKENGVDVEEELKRCLNNEAIYLNFVGRALNDAGFDVLGEAVEANDTGKIFELCHALKGVLGNLSLTPMYRTVSEMTELARANEDADYKRYYEELVAVRDKLKAY